MIGNRYELRDLLGKGGMSEVYCARDSLLEQDVAVKVARGFAADALVREGEALKCIKHRGVPTFIEAGRSGDEAWLVMQLIHGESLEAIIVRAAFSEGEFVMFARQLLEILVAAHEAGVLHLDLKPENVFVGRDAPAELRVTLLDFGIASQQHAPSHDSGDEVMGSLFFMAPERFDRKPVDCRTDLYSAGCVFYFSLTGQHPFLGDTAAQVMVAHLRHIRRPLCELRPDIHPAIAGWIESLMERRPEDRPASANAAIEDLERRLSERHQAL